MNEVLHSSEVYTLQQLEQLGHVLAFRHKHNVRKGGDSLLTTLRQNEDVLRTTYKIVCTSLQAGHKPAPAGEWLLDNFHLIEDQIQTSKRHLPRSFCKQLPSVEDPNWKRQPRIYLIARELINHSDGRLDMESISRIIRSYQKQASLQLGELWAFPIMLRLSLIDNLRHIAESIAASHIDQSNAKFWAEKISSIDPSTPQSLMGAVAELSESAPRLSSAFVSEFSRRIQMAVNSPSLALNWLEHEVMQLGSSLENHQNMASQNQAHDQMSISNSIASLRFLNDTDWREFVEDLSEVNEVLDHDPMGVFKKMDFATRDSYRHVVESLAKWSEYDELDVAKELINFAATDTDRHDRRSHIGYYLLGMGRRRFEEKLEVRYPIGERLRRTITHHSHSYYFSVLSAITLFLLGIISKVLWSLPHPPVPTLILIGLFLLPIIHTALSLLNWLTSLIIKPKIWPRMDFSSGVPSADQTLVAVPCLLTGINSIEKLIDDLEVRYLGNRDPHIFFALLTDFKDSLTQVNQEDEELYGWAVAKLEAINRKYEDQDGRQPFVIFHRNRQWNPSEGQWMGYERKRGKLSQLNRFLRSEEASGFDRTSGDTAQLSNVRYVLTLDADSSLPRETARKLIETIAHPLNQPKLNKKSGVVVEGYAIIQPRVTIHLRDTQASHFTRLFTDDYGIDPYTKTSADVYQDLFHEGSFIGKGIYDIDAFEASVKSRFPENRILSHDLIESGFARSGLVSDVQLVEEFPDHYSTDALRRHRWIRGDWQIAAWLMPKIPSTLSGKSANPLSFLSRWKIFDNLRRSLTPVASLSLFLLSWTMSVVASVAVIQLLIFLLILPYLINALNVGSRFKGPIAIGQIVRDELRIFVRAFALALLSLVLLPYEAYLTLNGSCKSLYRIYVSHKNLLEWRSFADSVVLEEETIQRYYRSMWFAPCVGLLALAAALAALGTGALVIAPFAVAWVLAPGLAWWLSQARPLLVKPMTQKQTESLRILARKNWLYFETFLNAQDNWLPPDNFQEFPAEVVAHRTSPTNVGLSLLSSLAAYDFGYISLANLLDRTEKTFDSLDKLERHKGHFYNWYDTESLVPLNPLYVSTVDSGNLQGFLLVLKQGFVELAGGDLKCPRALAGLIDSLLTLEESFSSSPNPRQDLAKETRELLDVLYRTEVHPTGAFKNPVEALLFAQKFLGRIERACGREAGDERALWLKKSKEQIHDHLQYSQDLRDELKVELREKLQDLAARALGFMKMDYAFLYNRKNKLLAIGYHVADSRLDQSYYDLLASEARLASFLAIADGSIPVEHWFALGRQLTYSGKTSTLLSWSGSMFEYLMPLLIMPSYEGSLLNQACRQSVRSQIRYGKDRRVPWGISESAYNLTDSRYNYQYRAFGVPGLGFKRGLEHDLVIAPYATVMALMLEPSEAVRNLEVLKSKGFMGRYGYYEAIDYTPSRLPAGSDHALIRSFMAHHQGMSFLSLLHFLLKQPMQSRIMNDPRFKATELLLHERMPKMAARITEVKTGREFAYEAASFEESFRVIKNPSRPIPEAHLLGNENYHLMFSSSGSGYSSWKGIHLTRWREDRTRDAHGYFIYLKDSATGDHWSAGFQPTRIASDRYEAIFSEGRAEVRRLDYGIDTHLEVAVSPDDDVELRRVTLTNTSSEVRVLEVTSYAEVVMATLDSDQAHPAFSNLFVESESVGEKGGLLCRRRAREPDQHQPWLFHTMYVHDAEVISHSFETDRAAFIGRNLSPKAPGSLHRELSNTVGAVLDPIISVRRKIVLKPGKVAVIDCILGIHSDRDSALQLLERCAEKSIADRILELAWTHGHVLLQQLNCSASEALLYGRLASFLIYGGSKLRTQGATIKANHRPLSAFWSYGISGDNPILLLRLYNQNLQPILLQLLRGHDYWRRKGLLVDFVIWNEDRSGYRQELNERVLDAIRSVGAMSLMDKHGGIFLKRPDLMADEDRIIFQAAARVILSDQAGTLQEQMDTARSPSPKKPKSFSGSVHYRRAPSAVHAGGSNPLEKLFASNGIGGFRQDGKEYVMRIGSGKKTPMPWVNVLANANFGTLVSETGSSYTWSENAHEHRLTPWFNDPVSDPTGEAVYLRDEESGDYWAPTPGPRPGPEDCEVRHGFGYSSFATQSYGIQSLMTVFVAAQDPVKVVRIKLENRSQRHRTISLTSVFELVLGEHRSRASNQILTEYDPSQNILSARNVFAAEFKDRIAFLSCLELGSSVTGDRREFIGRNRSLADPEGMEASALSDKVGTLFDPCLAMRTAHDLAPGSVQEFAFIFGAARDGADARQILKKYRSASQIQLALDGVHEKWARLLGRISMETPDEALNVLGNGWLLYQTLSSRIWGRTGFYQSGGAYGFRDQLQDMMAVVYCAPELVREHIVRSAGRQFIEGDVQHWWHPPLGRGVRTLISDDYLWLPFVTEHYIKVTGDWSVLDVSVAFLTARVLPSGVESEYGLPLIAEEQASVYLHCVKALEFGMKYGSHGLPLMGSGDWNDGMNHVGIEGKGESIWLGFFLLDVLNKFSRIAKARGDQEFVRRCGEEVEGLHERLERHAWDGDWYKRAFFDDGSPLGSKQNQECRLDSLPQSWSVLSGAATEDRGQRGMQAVYETLVRKDIGVIKLFDPPFDRQRPNPGYISGYLPGVRENGGQYTHAALWVVMGFARLGDLDKALELLTLINPVRLAGTAEGVARYKIEPYVLAGDVYAGSSHAGRGGWSWYTGSAAWFYRVILETFLGFDLREDRLHLKPRLPTSWDHLRYKFPYKTATYHIEIRRSSVFREEPRVTLDGVLVDEIIALLDDGKLHQLIADV